VKNKELTIHGDTRVDPYYWLNERDNPEVIAYLEKENDYLSMVMKSTEQRQADLFNEITGRIRQDDETVPFPENGYYYYNRFIEGKEYPVYCRKRENLESEEEILLDVNVLAEGFAYFSVSGIQVSPDNRLMAFGVDTVSRRKYEIRIKNLENGEMLADRIPETTGSVAWANDNRTFFYTRKNPVTLRSEKIFRHATGTAPTGDPLVYYEADETYGVDISRTRSGRYLLIESGSTLSTECRFLDAGDPGGDFRILQPREEKLEYSVDHFGDHFYIRTNWNAPNFKLMKTPVDRTAKESWTEVIPYRPDVLLENFTVFTGHLVAMERVNGLSRLRIMDTRNSREHYIDFGEEAYSVWFSVNKVMDTNIFRYSYTSMTTPSSIFDYNMDTREKKLMKQDAVLGGFSPDDYESRRLFAKARDGVSVPVSLVYKKGLKLSGRNPTLLYGYGSYGISMNAGFSYDRLSLLNRGFVYAIAHVRGGQEMGRQWYEDGKLLKKMNTFTDFIDVAEFLVESGYTSPDHLCANGGSAGGLLMGAILNLRPDLFRVVIANVPFVDVVTTMLDSSIPLTTAEYDEWGNPNIREYYDYMLSYSPYDQVKAAAYPAILVTTGLHDSQVQYFEPAKWVAKLRDMKTDDHLLLLKTDMEAGHGGASGRFERYRLIALEYAFLFDQMGI
jgi:oligopeptidase B